MKNNPVCCQCGCGQRASIAKQTDSRHGCVKGQPVKFISGHQNRGSMHPNWKGGKRLDGHGYIFIWKPGHFRADANGYVREHILVAEEVLGKPLPTRAVVHHANEIRSDNRKENLVICQDKAYHELLHIKMRALKACGHADWRKCWICREYDDPENLTINDLHTPYHKKCNTEYTRLRRKKIITNGAK